MTIYWSFLVNVFHMILIVEPVRGEKNVLNTES